MQIINSITLASRVATFNEFGSGTGNIVLDDLACAGTESSLFDCPHPGVNVHNCGHIEDAGVVCTG